MDTLCGPVTTSVPLAKYLAHMDRAKATCSRCVLGGRRPEDAAFGEGWFVEPTIFTYVDNAMPIAREEVFGPVLAVIPFSDEDEAVAKANDSDYGLAAGGWTTEQIGRESCRGRVCQYV